MSPQDRGRTDRSIWLVLAFAEPPKGLGFTRSTSGKCWWRRIEGREWAVHLGRKLAEMGIHGVCKRVRDEKSRRSDRGGLQPVGAVMFVPEAAVK